MEVLVAYDLYNSSVVKALGATSLQRDEFVFQICYHPRTSDYSGRTGGGMPI